MYKMPNIPEKNCYETFFIRLGTLNLPEFSVTLLLGHHVGIFPKLLRMSWMPKFSARKIDCSLLLFYVRDKCSAIIYEAHTFRVGNDAFCLQGMKKKNSYSFLFHLGW